MILVTGATGFVGRQVVRELISRGRPVRALARAAVRAAVLPSEGIEVVHGDVLDPESLNRACDGVDAVIHLVAVIRERRERTFHQVNCVGTSNVLRAAESNNVGRVVLASAIGAGSDPSIRYMYSRWIAEQEAIRSPVRHTIVRSSTVFGEGDEFFNVLAAQVKLFPIVPVAGDGRATFQPIAVDDLAKCLAAALEREDVAGRTVEVGGPDLLTYDQMLDIIAETLGARLVKAHVPLSLMRPVVGFMERLLDRPPATCEQLKMLTLDNTAGQDSVEREFGFKPRSLRGNLDYITRIGLLDALNIHLGSMPAHIRDH